MRTNPRAMGILLAGGAAAAAIAIFVATRSGQIARPPEQPNPSSQQSASSYADPSRCASCHAEIARTYAQTGMARSFSKVRGGGSMPDVRPGDLHHAASDRYYATIERDGRLYQRRHQTGVGGSETNVVELEAHYVIGSGRHARTFLHRTPDGRLVELPVSWYAERGGFWAMSPGYDRPAHLDFRRVIADDCMACHNSYPEEVLPDEGNGARFGEPLPEGIGCQRCHGPGQAHIDAIERNDVEAARRAIANPRTFDRDRQLETCMQCHLETSSSPLPYQIRRFDRPPLSYLPGQPLGDYFIHFDHAPGTGRDDKFEIAGGAYRLRKSACFLQSEMTCTTCHDPHDIPRGEDAVRKYVAVCQSCHSSVHPNGAPRVEGASPTATCLDCHMPKRRAEDAVHVVMTDHYIQRHRALSELLKPRREAENFEHGAYRGEVVLYYPPSLPGTPENDLYLAVAQVQHGSNLTEGIRRLEAAVARHKPERAEFYHELARAYARVPDFDAVIRWSEEALRRDSRFAAALKELATASTAKGSVAQAIDALERAVALRPRDGFALADLGNAYLLQNRIDDALSALRRALDIDPSMPRANNTMALTALKKGDVALAETHFRAAISSQPDLAEAQLNLGNLLAGRRDYAAAVFHFERAIQNDPKNVEARLSHGMALALMQSYDRAVEALQAAVQLAPQLSQAHLTLGDVFAAMGRTGDAARAYERAIETAPGVDAKAEAAAALRSLKP